MFMSRCGSLVMLLCFCLLLTASTGCATIRPAVVVSTFGDVNVKGDRELSETASQRQESPKGVRVISGELPEGLELVDGAAKLVVKAGYEGTYRVLGTVEADYARKQGEATLRNMFWTWDYDETWRKGLCYWQIPFKVLTLGIWSYVIPFHYPCIATAPGEEEARKEALIEHLRRGASAMGGNLVVLISGKDLFVVTGNQYGVSTNVVKGVSLRAFVLNESAGAGGAQQAPIAKPSVAPVAE